MMFRPAFTWQHRNSILEIKFGVIKVGEFVVLILSLMTEYLGFGQEKAFIQMSFFQCR